MHSHPDTVAVFLSDAKGKFTYPDGKSESFDTKTGETRYTPASTHLPENTGDTPVDVIVIELKGKRLRLRKRRRNNFSGAGCLLLRRVSAPPNQRSVAEKNARSFRMSDKSGMPQDDEHLSCSLLL